MPEFTYAVGDVHGELDLMLEAFQAIENHSGGAFGRIVMLGDYVDRGPQSRGVIEYLIERGGDPRVVCLKGNHEAMMTEAFRTGALPSVSHWLFHGGEETLKSYGWTGKGMPNLALVPQEHIRWLNKLPLTLQEPGRVYVHAGLLPGISIDRQPEEACLWIRGKFFDAPADRSGLHVVHGHTPKWRDKPHEADPELLAHRTNLDSGAYMTGLLTVGVFDGALQGGPVEVFQVGAKLEPKAKDFMSRLQHS